MNWYPGYFSAPHFYATDRLSRASGPDFDPTNTVPVPAGSFVRRIAHAPHYDGAMKAACEPAVIALFGLDAVQGALVDPSELGWYRV